MSGYLLTSHPPLAPLTGPAQEAMIPGVVAAILAAVAGAVSSFVAYQRKKLCFRERGEGHGRAGGVASCVLPGPLRARPS